MSWEDSTIALMKEELRRLGMKVSGSHAELVERLDALNADVEVEEPEEEEAEVATVEGVIEALGAILEALGAASEGKSVTIVINPRDNGKPNAEVHHGGGSPEDDMREAIRNTTRQLLTAQPDGRSRALNILAQYGGSVSAVPDNDLERCLIGLQAELDAMTT